MIGTMTEPGAPGCRSARNSSLGFSTAESPVLAHAEDAHLLGGSKAILRGAEQSEGMAPVALEAEDCVHQMLEHAGAGDGALLGDVTHQHQDGSMRLGRRGQQGGALPHLGHRARG